MFYILNLCTIGVNNKCHQNNSTIFKGERFAANFECTHYAYFSFSTYIYIGFTGRIGSDIRRC